jgi:hypothetical protein
MGHSEDIIRLRKRVIDAVTSGVVDPNLKDFYEATLLQILNESERQRQVCVAQAEALRKQASVADGQASAYSAVGSIVYNVLNSYILQAEKVVREEQSRAAELAEKQEYAKNLEATTAKIVVTHESELASEPKLEPQPEPEPEPEPIKSEVKETFTPRRRKR